MMLVILSVDSLGYTVYPLTETQVTFAIHRFTA